MDVDLTGAALELIRRCAVDLPQDVEDALSRAREEEDFASTARDVLDTILDNVVLARDKDMPMCEDSGYPVFHVRLPPEYDMLEVREELLEAVRRAAEVPYIRQNAVDPVFGRNSGDGTGRDIPQIHWYPEPDGPLEVKLMLHGGGAENVGAQYALPDDGLGAGRDLEGVRLCVLDAVHRAQGRGCAPGIVGVGVGGARDSSYQAARRALLRRLDEPPTRPELAMLERALRRQLNTLGIGPLGLGGRTTALGVKVESVHRVPACYFVSVSYCCWAARRHTMTLEGGEPLYD